MKMMTRFLMTKLGCPFCLQMVKVISKINLRLQMDRRIHIIDCWEYEEFGLNKIPLIQKLHKEGLKHGYPFLYLDGCVIEPAPTNEMMKILLEEYLKEDFII